MIPRLVLIGSFLWVGLAIGAEIPKFARPDPSLTPGVVNPDALASVCTTKWGRDARHVTPAMKREVFARYRVNNYKGICAHSKRGCEIDHLISRELAGADAVENLWPQPYGGAWGAEKKDALENRLHKLVCSGELSLAAAQHEIATDWIASYKKRMQ